MGITKQRYNTFVCEMTATEGSTTTCVNASQEGRNTSFKKKYFFTKTKCGCTTSI